MNTDIPTVDALALEQSVPECVERAMRACAEREALVGDAVRLTYGAAARLADAVAHRLLQAGVAAGDRVALLIDRRPEAFASLVGAMKTGAIAVPLPCAHPGERLRQIAADARPHVWVADARGRALLQDAGLGGRPAIDLDSLTAAPDRDWPRVSADSPAILLYTSGSTGRPVGVVQLHRNLLHTIRACARAYGTTSSDRFAIFSTYATGQGVSAALGALTLGACTCVLDVRNAGVPRLSGLLRDERISVYLSSATMFRTFAGSLSDGTHFPDLRLVRIGGERVTGHDVSLFRRRFSGGCRMVIAYSITECGTVSTYAVDDGPTMPGETVPVGRPVEDTEIVIVDEDGRTVAQGDVGEIVVRGPFLSPGYWHDPERTARVFQPATSDDGAQRACRTGDLGRLRADGVLEHHGRKDFRLKIRGHRVELEDVEAVLERHPAVTRAVVVGDERMADQPRLVAYLQRHPDRVATVDALRRHAALRLPDYMIPSAFVLLDRLPLSPAGKPDRQALPPPPDDRPALSTPFVPPRTRIERTIAGIWSEVLSIRIIGIDDDFLALGGDSLRAMQAASRLNEAFGIDVSIVDLFDTPTIAEMTAIVERRIASHRGDGPPR